MTTAHAPRRTVTAPEGKYGPTILMEYDTPAQLARHAAQGPQCRRRLEGGDGRFHGPGATLARTVDRACNGWPEAVEAARALLDKYALTADTLDTGRVELDQAGAYPCVPSMLAGDPEHMWTRAEHLSATGPVKIYVNLASSAGISAEILQRRGGIVAALAWLVSAHRPVELIAMTTLDGTHDGRNGGVIVTVPLPTAPLDIGIVAAVLSDPAFARGLMYGVCWDHAEYRGGWPAGYDAPAPGQPEYSAHVRDVLALAPDDVYLPAPYIADPSVKDPDAWIRARLGALLATTQGD